MRSSVAFFGWDAEPTLSRAVGVRSGSSGVDRAESIPVKPTSAGKGAGSGVENRLEIRARTVNAAANVASALTALRRLTVKPPGGHTRISTRK